MRRAVPRAALLTACALAGAVAVPGCRAVGRRTDGSKSLAVGCCWSAPLRFNAVDAERNDALAASPEPVFTTAPRLEPSSPGSTSGLACRVDDRAAGRVVVGAHSRPACRPGSASTRTASRGARSRIAIGARDSSKAGLSLRPARWRAGRAGAVSVRWAPGICGSSTRGRRSSRPGQSVLRRRRRADYQLRPRARGADASRPSIRRARQILSRTASTLDRRRMVPGGRRRAVRSI